MPLIAVHMFVFYFGILADDTPPVALAAFAAAAISGGDPIKTGLQGFYYDIRTAILPFLFISKMYPLVSGERNCLICLPPPVLGPVRSLSSCCSFNIFIYIRLKLLYEPLFIFHSIISLVIHMAC